MGDHTVTGIGRYVAGVHAAGVCVHGSSEALNTIGMYALLTAYPSGTPASFPQGAQKPERKSTMVANYFPTSKTTR